MNNTQNFDDELRSEYNFDYSKAIRGKYLKRLLEEGANMVVLEPDITSSAAVNDALRSYLFHTAPNKSS